MADRNDMSIQDSTAAASASPKRPLLEIDLRKYLKYTQQFDATEEEQLVLIASLRQIMLAFVDMGFDLNPVQHVPQIACESNAENKGTEPESLGPVIQSIIANDRELTTAFAEESEGQKG